MLEWIFTECALAKLLENMKEIISMRMKNNRKKMRQKNPMKIIFTFPKYSNEKGSTNKWKLVKTVEDFN